MSLEETDAGLRRRYLIFIAEKLSERDHVLEDLSVHLRKITGANIDADLLAFLKKMQEIDGLLMQSRFTRAISNATWFDHMIANVVGFANARPVAFIATILNFTIFGFFSYLVATGKIFPWLSFAFNMVIGVSSAEAATFDFSKPDNVKIVILFGIAILLAIAFLFFAGAACLSGDGETRKRCWEFVKHMSTFMLGIIAGYFSHPL